MSSIAQRSFSGGEIAPSAYARTDFVKYATGLRTCRNFIVQRHGGVTNRPGTEYVAEVKDSTKTVRLVRFHYNDAQTYVMEFGNLYIRFHKNGAPVLSGGVPYEIATPYVEADLMGLRFVQSADVMTIVHNGYAPRNLSRIAETNWTLALVTFGPTIAPPTNFTRASGGLVSADATVWGVTAVSAATGEESVVASYQANFDGDPANAVVLTWTAVAGANKYNVYRELGSTSYTGYSGTGTFGIIGSTTAATFSDTGPTAMPPDYEIQPPRVSQAADFNASGEYPRAITYYQQRRLFANSTDNPETVWGSRTNDFGNFVTHFPLQDDDAIEFTLVGRRVNQIEHMLDLGRLILFTSDEEKMVEGDEAGILRPDAINPRKLSAHGSGSLPPLEIDDSAIYVQSRGSQVRDFKPVSADSYEGTDLTVFAAHLFDGYTLRDWDYAEIPHSVVWACRSDGTLLGLTYLRDHAIWGWHRHDTDGDFENVVTVPEGDEDRVYVVVKRTINGSTKRYIERFASRHFTDIEDAVFLDSALSVDGWNTAATTLTISGGTLWSEVELLTLTASANTFVAGDVGNVFIVTLEEADGVETDRVRMTVESYTSATVVKARPDRTVVAGLRVARSTWARAITAVTGLSHLEGKEVSVFADGYVVSSPNNSHYDTLTVTAGAITLPEPYAVIRVGLPYTSDLVTLDLDAPSAATIMDRKKLINRLGLYIEASRGIWAGMPDQPTDALPLNGLQEYKARAEEDYESPIATKTDFIEINIEARWDRNGRQLVRQVDPLPLTVLSITPIGYV